MIRVRHMSDTGKRGESAVRWCLDEYLWGDPAGSNAPGTAPGGAQLRSRASVALAPRLTSAQGAAFLRRMVTRFPFPVQAVQSQGGSEFLKEFGLTVEELPADLGGLETALLRWNQVYETVRPHRALGYKTPDQFHQEWLGIHSHRKEALSDMS